MLWFVSALPELIFILFIWFISGALVNRYILNIQDGDTLAILAFPVGIVINIFVINIIAQLIFFPTAVWVTVITTFFLALLALFNYQKRPLSWLLSRTSRIVTLVVFTIVFGVLFFIFAREIFVDDIAHATMSNLMAHGLFPIHFQCNPDFSASYHYGGNILISQVMVITGIDSWYAMDIVRAVSAVSLVMMTFVIGWHYSGSVTGGLITGYMSLMVSTMGWVLLPFTNDSFSLFFSSDFLDALKRMTRSTWDFSIVYPGFITPPTIHYVRSQAWTFAPFSFAMMWILLDLKLAYARKTIVGGVFLATIILLQSSALFILLPGFGVLFLVKYFTKFRIPSLDFSPFWLLIISLIVVIPEGGLATDIIFSGTPDATTAFKLIDFTPPSCRWDIFNDDSLVRGTFSECALLSLANLNFVPILIIPFGIYIFRKQLLSSSAIILLSGSIITFALANFISYGYFDWDFARVYTFSVWIITIFFSLVLLSLHKRKSKYTIPTFIVLLMMTLNGWVALYNILDGTELRDASALDFSPLPPQIDIDMMKYQTFLPLTADVFDPAGCMGGPGTRPGYLFGRYSSSSLARGPYRTMSESFMQVYKNPSDATFYENGYTDSYITDTWWQDVLDETDRDNIRYGAFELIGIETNDSGDFRALLHVCHPDEPCERNVYQKLSPVCDTDKDCYKQLDSMFVDFGNEEINSNKIGSPDDIIKLGWFNNKQWNDSSIQWAGQQAVLFLPISTEKDVILKFRAFLPTDLNPNEPQILSISLNNIPQASITLKDGWHEYVVIVSQDAFLSNIKQLLTLDHSWYITQDEKRLSAAYDWLLLEPLSSQ